MFTTKISMNPLQIKECETASEMSYNVLKVYISRINTYHVSTAKIRMVVILKFQSNYN